MITFMYTFNYNDEEQHEDPESDDGGCDSPIETEAIEVSIGETADLSDQKQPALFSSVRVYAIAEKYGIPLLKELAKERFCTWTESNWAHEDFPDIVREVFQSTPESDQGLRDIVVQVVAKHANRLTEKAEFRDAIQECGDLGLGTLCQVLATHSEKMSDLRLRLRERETEIEMLKGQITRNEQGMRTQANEMKSTMSKLNSLGECRHCKKDFNINVEAYLWGGVTVRCKGCRTRDHQN